VQRVGVEEEQTPPVGQLEAAPAALDEPLAELELECADLLRDGRLRQEERRGGAGEGSPVGDLTERQEAPRIEYPLSLSDMHFDYLT
jgi:hypothetical protein